MKKAALAETRTGRSFSAPICSAAASVVVVFGTFAMVFQVLAVLSETFAQRISNRRSLLLQSSRLLSQEAMRARAPSLFRLVDLFQDLE